MEDPLGGDAEDRCDALRTAVPDPVVALDTGARVTAVDGLGDVVGLGREALLGEHASAFMTEGSVERWQAAVRQLREDEDRERATVELALVTRDGDRRPHDGHVALLPPDDSGEVPGALGVLRAHAGATVSDRQFERYERLVTAMGDGVYALDAQGRYTQVNEFLLALTGYDRDELLGTDASLLHDADERARFERGIEDLLRSDDETVKTVEATIETAKGDRIPVEVNLTLLPSDDGTFQGTVGVVRDVTERKARERELERYESIVEASGDPVYALDTEGRFTFSNEAHQELLGYDEGELVGQHASMVITETAVENGRELIRELLASDDRRRGTYEMSVVRADGERVPTENHIALLYDDDGAFRGTVGVLRDISDRKRRERELQRQNERLERFASVLSHDVRNPLNLAQGHLDLAREDYDGEHLAEVHGALERIDRLVDDVLTLARQGQAPEDTGPVPLADVARDGWATSVGDAGDLEVATDAVVVADGSRLLRLLENLFRNAEEHAGPDPQVTVGSTAGGFFVADDGPGIPPEDRERVFESGVTTEEDGTGFGLAIVQEIAEAHGWTAKATESASGGARFAFGGVEIVED